MLPQIVQHSEALTSFILALQLALYQPQIRHLLQIVDALLICNQRKTLSDLSRFLHQAPDPKALADFFRESPWTVDLISQPRKKFMVLKLLGLAAKAGLELKILASLDDSLGKKGKATKHLQAVDYHHNHSESTKKRQAWCNGYVYVELVGQHAEGLAGLGLVRGQLAPGPKAPGHQENSEASYQVTPRNAPLHHGNRLGKRFGESTAKLRRFA